jgi:hypothetical protein
LAATSARVRVALLPAIGISQLSHQLDAIKVDRDGFSYTRMANLYGHFVTRATKLSEVYLGNGARTNGIRIKLGEKFINWLAKVFFYHSSVVPHPMRAHVVVKVTKDIAKLLRKQITSDRHPLPQFHESRTSYFQHPLRKCEHSF